jgi:AcrR family transcriptional regulator
VREDGSMPTLVERNRQRTREDIETAAARLFHDRGFAGTTVEAIANEAGVARRTFFRYFPNKEELALSMQEEYFPLLLTCLADRPASETPTEALCRAILLQVMELYDGPDHRHAAARLLEGQATLMREPRLQGALMARETGRQREIARVLAERLGSDPDADLRPRLIAAVVVRASYEAVAIALESYRPGEPVEALDIFRRAFCAAGLFCEPGSHPH